MRKVDGEDDVADIIEERESRFKKNIWQQWSSQREPQYSEESSSTVKSRTDRSTDRGTGRGTGRRTDSRTCSGTGSRTSSSRERAAREAAAHGGPRSEVSHGGSGPVESSEKKGKTVKRKESAETQEYERSRKKAR